MSTKYQENREKRKFVVVWGFPFGLTPVEEER